MPRTPFAAILIGAFSLTALVSTSFADTLIVNRMKAESKTAMPRQGSSMAQVEATYGAPSKKHSAVGKPPITRWDYPAFSVYFEYKHVIDSVANKATESEMGAKPVPANKQ